MDAHLVLPIEDLQPTNRLKPVSVSYLETLSVPKILSYGSIYVLRTDMGNLITEGHNRTAVLAKRKINRLEVCAIDVRGFKRGRIQLLDYYFRQAGKMRKEGIYTVYDLWQA